MWNMLDARTYQSETHWKYRKIASRWLPNTAKNATQRKPAKISISYAPKNSKYCLGAKTSTTYPNHAKTCMAINTNTRHNTWKMQMHIKHALEVWKKMPNKLNIKIWKKTKKNDGKKKKKGNSCWSVLHVKKNHQNIF